MEGIHKEVENEALDAIEKVADQIADKVVEVDGEDVPTDLPGYNEEYAYEGVDLGWKSPVDAVTIIEALSEHEANPGTTDFEEDWRKALAILAAETYRNAVFERFSELMESLNTEIYRAGSTGGIQWRFPEPEFPSGVLDWSPAGRRQREAFEKQRQRFMKEFPQKVRAQIKQVISAFVARERP